MAIFKLFCLNLTCQNPNFLSFANDATAEKIRLGIFKITIGYFENSMFRFLSGSIYLDI